MKRNRKLFKLDCLNVIFSIVILVGLIWLLCWSKLFEYIIDSNLVLKPNNTLYDIWKENPFPLKIDFYFHNWTNPQDINNGSVKPRFEQIGPYRFTETKQKVNITWNENNNTVTFKHLKRWYFESDISNGSLSDPVVTINAVFLSSAYQMRNWNSLLKIGFSSFASQSLHVTKTVGELLFEGYQDPLIDMGKKFPMLAIVDIPNFDRFGWFYTRNGSTEFDGTFNMGTGVGNIPGRLLRWNFDDKTPFNEGECGKIRGSAGEIFPAKAKRSEIEFFSPDMCRFVKLDYSVDVMVHNILGYKYAAGPGLLDNGTLRPENKCFCGGECVPSGAVNVSACRYGSPAFVSLPHFYGADPFYTDAVEGLNPDRSKHDFYITLEPNTGIALGVAARLQLNLLLQPIRMIKAFVNVPRVFIPVLWFEQKLEMPEDMAFKIKILLHFPIICISLGCIIITTFLIIIFIRLILAYVHDKSHRNRKKILYTVYSKGSTSSEQKPLNLSHSRSESRSVSAER